MVGTVSTEWVVSSYGLDSVDGCLVTIDASEGAGMCWWTMREAYCYA